MLTMLSFNDPVPDPTKAPQPPSQQQPAPHNKPGRSIFVTGRPKARFLWPPDCLWPFTKDDSERNS